MYNRINKQIWNEVTGALPSEYVTDQKEQAELKLHRIILCSLGFFVLKRKNPEFFDVHCLPGKEENSENTSDIK